MNSTKIINFFSIGPYSWRSIEILSSKALMRISTVMISDGCESGFTTFRYSRFLATRTSRPSGFGLPEAAVGDEILNARARKPAILSISSWKKI
jgi:hypothetical protein